MIYALLSSIGLSERYSDCPRCGWEAYAAALQTTTGAALPSFLEQFEDHLKTFIADPLNREKEVAVQTLNMVFHSSIMLFKRSHFHFASSKGYGAFTSQQRRNGITGHQRCGGSITSNQGYNRLRPTAVGPGPANKMGIQESEDIKFLGVSCAIGLISQSKILQLTLPIQVRRSQIHQLSTKSPRRASRTPCV